MIIKKCVFKTSVSDSGKLPEDTKIEIAVAGKSNVGKSSFINFLASNSKLARTSKEPGRTRLINFFDVNDGEWTLVDLPGYGYAEVSKAEKESWGVMMEGYLRGAPRLAAVFVLLDIRHDPGAHDLQLINYLHYYGIQFTIIATKADKLSRQQIAIRRKALATAVKMGVDNVLVTSSSARIGKEDVLSRIDQIIDSFSSAPIEDDLYDNPSEEN